MSCQNFYTYYSRKKVHRQKKVINNPSQTVSYCLSFSEGKSSKKVPYISKPGKKCHTACGGKYGPCDKYCGVGKSCCRKGRSKCRKELMPATISSSSRCIGLKTGTLLLIIVFE